MSALVAIWVLAPEAAAAPSLESTGSSFAGVAIQQWVGQASTLFGLNINWQVSSSVEGLDNFAQNEVDFAASDIPYSSGQATSEPNVPYQYMPDVAGGLAFMYNLTDQYGQRITGLVLDAHMVDQIFIGAITSWTNPAILDYQSSTVQQELKAMARTTILPVYRTDAAGENYLLSDYLIHMDGSTFEAFQSAVGTGAGVPSASWPTPPSEGWNNPSYPGWPNNMIGQSGSSNAADYVAAASSNGAIAYVETAYAIEHAMPVASLINESGNAVQPTSLNDATALEKAILYSDLTQNLTGVYTNPLPDAYPLSSYSYLVTPCQPSLAAAENPRATCSGPSGTSPFPADKGQALGQFVAFLACAGQQQMAVLGYSPLPPNLVQEDFDAVGRMTGGQEPPPVSAATCKNPYVDGQTHLPGEPVIIGQAPPGTGHGSSSGPGGSGGTGNGGGSTSAGSSGSASGGVGAAGTGTSGGGTGTAGTGGSSGRSAAARKSGPRASGGGAAPSSGAAKYLKNLKKTNAGGSGSSSFLRADELRAAATSDLGFASPVVQIAAWCAVFAAAIVVPVFVLTRRRRARVATFGGAPSGTPR